MARVTTSQLDWKLIHIAPIHPIDSSAGLSCMDVLQQYVPTLTTQDDIWIKPLEKKLNEPYMSQSRIHCEATLMALAANRSAVLLKSAGIEDVCYLSHILNPF